MKEKKSLSQSNPYLRDRRQRQLALVKSVCSSSAIEGIDVHKLLAEYLLQRGIRIKILDNTCSRLHFYEK